MTQLQPIQVGGYGNVRPARTQGAPPRLEWLPIAKLVVDAAYQREIGPQGRNNVRRIAERFNWSMFSPVIVAAAGGDRFAIVDGQHRVTAAALCGLERVPCQIIEAVRAEQAAAFFAINDAVTKLSRMQLHHAALAAGDPAAEEAAAVCAHADCVILRYPKPWNEIAVGETMAVVAIGKAIRRFGADTVTTALRAIRDSGDGNAGMLRSQVIFGAAEVLHDHPEWRDAGGALLEAFDTIDLEQMFDEARTAAAAMRGSSITDQFESRLVTALEAHFGKGVAA